MLIAKGSSCRFRTEESGTISAGRGAVMLHDPAGRSWSSRSLLFLPINRDGEEATDAQMKGAPKDYLGRNYRGKVGHVNLPSKSLAAWTYVDECVQLWYTRPGTKAPGRYQHPFNKATSIGVIFKGTRHVKLYRLGSAFRLELGRGSIVDGRGIVFP
jgi:hypothetical protein